MLGYRKSAVALSAVVLPLLLTGCSSSSVSAEEKAVDAGRSWIVVDEGKVTPSPTSTFGKASPTPEATLPPLPTGPTPTARPGSTCTPTQRVKGAVNGLAVQPGSTSAVVTWYHGGGANIVDYRVTAAGQNLVKGAQKELGWTRTAPATCGDVSVTVTGLDPRTPYIFTLDVVMTRSNATLDGTYTETIARSRVVSTT